jgi:RNA polymerase sigma-70 factor (sigma-E family)
VQSALYRTFLHWDRLRAVEAAESYTHTTMIRLAGRWWRRRWRGEIPTEALPDDGDSPESAGRAEAGLDLLRALQSLPVGQRAVLVLRYLSDLSEEQTAQILGCSIGTVKSRSSRAMSALRELTWLRADLEHGDTESEETSHG